MRRHHASAAALLIAALAGCGASRPATSTKAGVIRAWTDAVRERHYARAAALFALASTITNGVTVRARKRADVDVFNRSLACGAVLKGTRPAGDGRVRATFRLVAGPGGPCSGDAHVTFRIQRGHITEWVREDTAPPAGTQQT